MILSSNLLREIEQKRNVLVSKIDHKLRIYKKVLGLKEIEARVHSARGEVPLEKLHYMPNGADKERFTYVLSGINHAWDFGVLAYSGKPTEEFIEKFAWHFDENLFGGDTAEYRRPGTIDIVQGWNYLPPEPLRIKDELWQYLTHNPELDQSSIPEQAFLYNFHISRIQPFRDCNKRTGKNLQNLHLFWYYFPPATIKEGETGFYNKLLIEAIDGFREREGQGKVSKKESRLFDFLGTKVNMNLDEILDKGDFVPEQIKEKTRKLVYNKPSRPTKGTIKKNYRRF